MGCWSVACGVSNIAITAGNKCVLLPLRKNEGDYGYFEYIPAMLPIFGEYDDYGGIENIEKNINTELIEKVTGVTIEDFCTFLVDGKYTYDRSEAGEVRDKINNPELMDKLRFMWMDRKVYDFMTSNIQGNTLMGGIGFPFILRSLKFERDKDSDKQEGRYKKAWVREGKRVYTDGQWMQFEDGSQLYHIDAKDYEKGNISYHFNLTEEELALEESSVFSFHEGMNDEEANKNLLRVLTGRNYTIERVIDYSLMLDKYKKEGNLALIEMCEEMIKSSVDSMNIFHKEYCDNISVFKKGLAEIGNLYQNLHPMSGNFRPHELYLTPQCGEYRDHQVILDKFSEINQSYIDEIFEDEDEED